MTYVFIIGWNPSRKNYIYGYYDVWCEIWECHCICHLVLPTTFWLILCMMTDVIIVPDRHNMYLSKLEVQYGSTGTLMEKLSYPPELPSRDYLFVLFSARQNKKQRAYNKILYIAFSQNKRHRGTGVLHYKTYNSQFKFDLNQSQKLINVLRTSPKSMSL